MSAPYEKYYTADAVRDLRYAGLNAEEKAYGFYFAHEDTAGRYTGECGSEHDWSISLPIRISGGHPRWLIRFSMREMAELLIAAFAKVHEGKSASLIAAIEEIDREYDHDNMANRLTELRKAHGYN